MRKIAVGLILALTLAVAKAGEASGVLVGSVTMADGRPVKSGRVVAISLSGKRLVWHSATIAADGKYRFGALPAGDYVIHLLRNGSSEKQARGGLEGEIKRSLEAMFGDAATVAALAAIPDLQHRVTVKAGVVAQHDIRRPTYVSVSGRVRSGADGVEGVEISLVRLKSDGKPGWSIRRSRRTDDAGFFEFPSMEPGDYMIVCWLDSRKLLCGQTRISPDKPNTLTVKLGCFGLRIRLLDANGRVMTRFRVFVRHASERYVGTDCVADFTGEDDSLMLSNLPAGRYVIQAFVNDATARGVVVLGPSSRLPTATLKLVATGTLAIRVRDTAGNPVEHVPILVMHPSFKPNFGRYTDRSGEVRLVLTAQEWLVGLRSETNPFLWRGKPKRVRLSADETTSVVLRVP
jgi:hypothetical protein